MEHPAEILLASLERSCPPINDNWRGYIASRSVEVRAWIRRLRDFASSGQTNLRTQAVMIAVNSRADDLEERLIAVLRQ